MNMLKTALIILASGVFSISGEAKNSVPAPSGGLNEKIDMYLSKSGYLTAVASMYDALKDAVKHNPQVASQLTEERKQRVLGQTLAHFRPIYAKRFSAQEMDALIQFVDSNVGRKMVQASLEIQSSFGNSPIIALNNEISNAMKATTNSKGSNRESQAGSKEKKK